MALQIRVAEPGDLTALCELYRHLHLTDDPLPEERRLQALWAAMLSHPGLSCIVGLEDDRLASSCCVAIIPNLTRGGRPYALIENVVTHQEYRRRGFARAVIHDALARAWSAGCYKAMLFTGSHRPETHRFYESCGFRSGDKTVFVARPG